MYLLDPLVEPRLSQRDPSLSRAPKNLALVTFLEGTLGRPPSPRSVKLHSAEEAIRASVRYREQDFPGLASATRRGDAPFPGPCRFSLSTVGNKSTTATQYAHVYTLSPAARTLLSKSLKVRVRIVKCI